MALPGPPQFPVGKGGGFDPLQAFTSLKSLVYETVQRMTMMGHTIERLSNHFARIAELSGRVSASFLLIAGLPKILRSDMRHAVLGDHDKKKSDFPGYDKIAIEREAWERKKLEIREKV